MASDTATSSPSTRHGCSSARGRRPRRASISGSSESAAHSSSVTASSSSPALAERFQVVSRARGHRVGGLRRHLRRADRVLGAARRGGGPRRVRRVRRCGWRLRAGHRQALRALRNPRRRVARLRQRAARAGVAGAGTAASVRRRPDDLGHGIGGHDGRDRRLPSPGNQDRCLTSPPQAEPRDRRPAPLAVVSAGRHGVGRDRRTASRPRGVHRPSVRCAAAAAARASARPTRAPTRSRTPSASGRSSSWAGISVPPSPTAATSTRARRCRSQQRRPASPSRAPECTYRTRSPIRSRRSATAGRRRGTEGRRSSRTGLRWR